VLLVLLAAVVLVAAVGCSKSEESAEKVLATINDQKITEKQFQKRLDLYGFLFGNTMKKELEKEETRQQVFDELVEETLLVGEANSRGIDPSSEEVQKEYETMKARIVQALGSTEEYQKELADNEVTEEDLRGFLGKRLIIQKLYNELTTDVTVSDKEVEEYFEENRDSFSTPERVHARHILVETEKMAQTVLAELEGGKDFGELAAEYSIDEGTADDGGDLGFFQRGMMIPEFEEVAFALEVGETTEEPVKTDYGFHIIKLIEREDSRPQTLDEVQELIHEQLVRQKKQELISEFVDQLRKDNDIKTDF
jgi:foldase protein PrsA